VKKFDVGIVCFERNLRLSDNRALEAAIENCQKVVLLFVWAPCEDSLSIPGEASRVWLHHSLKNLDSNLQNHGLRLCIRSGATRAEVLTKLIEETGAQFVSWSRRYEPDLIKSFSSLKKMLQSKNVEVQSFCDALLFDPWEIKNKTGGPYKVFTPFYRTLLARQNIIQSPLKVSLQNVKPLIVESESIESLNLLPKISWDKSFYPNWKIGEKAALERLKNFSKNAIAKYCDQRDVPSLLGTSRMSPHLHFGEIGPRQIWHLITEEFSSEKVAHSAKSKVQAEFYLREIVWREFSHHLLYHFPRLPIKPLRDEFAKFRWVKNKKHYQAWTRGMTGYPIVDAGMRELWQTGWMHNRVRMIVGSFLIKDLLISWQEGAAWFWNTLLDADLANNSMGWQWVAGCGADAAPFFRIFNPILQGEKFDPKGEYVRKFIPELANLPDRWIHRPFEADSAVLSKAAISLGVDYPRPLVDHAEARKEAVARFKDI